MLLVDGLTCHPEGLSDLRPGPTIAHSALNLSILEAISHRSKGGGSGEPIGGTTERRRRHEATLVAYGQIVN